MSCSFARKINYHVKISGRIVFRAKGRFYWCSDLDETARKTILFIVGFYNKRRELNKNLNIEQVLNEIINPIAFVEETQVVQSINKKIQMNTIISEKSDSICFSTFTDKECVLTFLFVPSRINFRERKQFQFSRSSAANI